MPVEKLITIGELSNILNIKRTGIQNKIKRGAIPSDCIVRLPGKKSSIRINISKLAIIYPSLKKYIFSMKNNIVDSENLMKPTDLANLLVINKRVFMRYIKSGLYPVIELPSFGKKKIYRILKKETLKLYPQLDCVINNKNENNKS